ncbi:MAG: hypothetical protein JO333_10060 [Verrucomicrobia bacterium]|nr:hypothetical protein [Verrucomicrobiota bacterium]
MISSQQTLIGNQCFRETILFRGNTNVARTIYLSLGEPLNACCVVVTVY